MYLKGKPVQNCTWSDIVALKTEAVMEDIWLEYKQELPGSSDNEKKEFVRDVTAFANKFGGVVVYGIAEKRDAEGRPTGLPEDICGLPSVELGQQVERLDSILRSTVDPPLHNFKFVPLCNGQEQVLLLGVGASPYGPHAVWFKKDGRFYHRTSAGKVQMTVAELRRSFLGTDQWLSDAERLRANRVNNVWFDELPSRRSNPYGLFLHLLPLGHRETKSDLSGAERALAEAEQILPDPDWRRKYCLDGVRAEAGRPRRIMHIHCFRDSGAELYVDMPTAQGRVEGEEVEVFNGANVEKYVLLFLEWFRRLIAFFELEPPFALLLSATGCSGRYLAENASRESYGGGLDADHRCFDRDLVLIPPKLLETCDYDSLDAARDSLQVFWQAAGWEADPYADRRPQLLAEVLNGFPKE